MNEVFDIMKQYPKWGLKICSSGNGFICTVFEQYRGKNLFWFYCRADSFLDIIKQELQHHKEFHEQGSN
jgi:hypothetical protein